MRQTKIATFLGSLAGKAVVVAVVIVFALMFINRCTEGQVAETRAKLNEAEIGAVLDSVDVANAVAGSVNKTEAEIDAETKELVNDVLKAPPGRSNDAAIAAVCGMRAYRDRPECAGVREVNP